VLFRCLSNTPEDLVNEGLYKKIAVPFHPLPHHAISMVLLAVELGATKRKSLAAKSVLEAAHIRSTLTRTSGATRT
jgi:hypothetical protein